MAEAFDKEATYDEKIAPLMSQIIKVCQEADIPFVASFLYGRDDDGEEHLCSSALSHDCETFQRAVDVIQGNATTVPKTFAMTVTTGDR